MFRKPKRSAKKAGFRARKKTTDDNDDNDKEDDDQETSQELQEALKRAKNEHSGGGNKKAVYVGDDGGDNVMHHYDAKSTSTATISQKDLATATTQHHPKSMEQISKSASQKDPKRNKFLAGPIRAPTNIRTTCVFDYQPDICKDYKDTGFCGFGDTCIYLHDRGDTMSGWQLEKQWEEKQRSKKEEQEQQMEQFMNKVDGMENGNGSASATSTATATGEGAAAVTASDDGLPFACFLCRKAFEDPIVTTCGHYFCQGCLQDHYQQNNNDDNDDVAPNGDGDGDDDNAATGSSNDQRCPICRRDTHGVMNQPTKLITKKRKLLGRKATWQEFMDSRGRGGGDDDNDDE